MEEMSPSTGSSTTRNHVRENVTYVTNIGPKRRFSRRTLLAQSLTTGIGLAALGPFVTGCGSTGSSSGEVTLQFAAGLDQTGELVSEINLFNEQNRGKIKVDYLELPMVTNDQYTKVVSSLRSRSATPDIVHLDTIWPAQFAGSGWLAPLNDYASADYLQQFWPSAQTVGEIDGQVYGIQRFMDIGLLYYRTDLLDKYAQGTLPTTRDAFETLAKEIATAEAGNGIKQPYLIAGKKIEAIVCEWLEFIWGDGGTIGEPGSLVVNNDKGVAALQYFQDLIYSKKMVPQGTNTYAPADILNLFANGDAPFMRNWTFAHAVANNPETSKIVDKVGIAPLIPTAGNTGYGCTGGWVLGINARSRYKDQAWTFIDYMLSKETQTSLVKNAGLISSRPDVINDTTLQGELPHLSQLGTILENGQNRPQLQNYNQFSTPLQGAISAVLSNQQSPADALNGVQSQVSTVV